MVDMLINRDQEQKADAASGYGAFSEDGKEFIITSTATPVPWVNVLSNANFCSLISQNAQGFSFYLDPVRNRITRWNPDAMPLQRQGRYIFIKDDETSEIWTVNGLPCETLYDS